MTAEEIIFKYYPEDNALRRLLLHHSHQVADMALAVADIIIPNGGDNERAIQMMRMYILSALMRQSNPKK